MGMRVLVVPNRRIRIRLKELLYEKGMTQSELSKLTGIREATISSMANSVFDIVKVSNLIAVKDILCVESFDDLLEVVYLNENGEENSPR